MNPIRTTRQLVRDAAFDTTTPTPCTVLQLDGEPARVECWRELAIRTEHLLAGDIVEIAVSSFWPHKADPWLQEVGTYQQRWLARAIFEMSRPAPTLRVPPAREAFWGEFEKGMYAMQLRSVKGGY